MAGNDVGAVREPPLRGSASGGRRYSMSSGRLKAHASGMAFILVNNAAIWTDHGLSVDAPEVPAAPAGDGGVGLGVDIHFFRAQEAAGVLSVAGEIRGFRHD
jgi:hypothetical protein